jgi:hypothetical protein
MDASANEFLLWRGRRLEHQGRLNLKEESRGVEQLQRFSLMVFWSSIDNLLKVYKGW